MYSQGMSAVMRKALHPGPNLRGLMGLYEQNYQRLIRLVPEWPIPFDKALSHAKADRTLHLKVIERTKYTTSIHLTYLFYESGVKVADPDIETRLFHDAQLAEVTACGMHPRSLNFGNFDFENCSALEARWRRNLFLNKWLDYLLTHGHGFTTAHRPRRLAVPC